MSLTIFSQKTFSTSATNRICHNFYNNALESIIEPFEKETYKSKNKLISEEGRKIELIKLMAEYFEDLEFNPNQIALTICYADIFLTSLAEKGYKFNFSFLKSVIIIGVTPAYKMTNDVTYPNKTLEAYFKIKNLSQLEQEYSEMIDYKFYVSDGKVAEYLHLLMQ